MNTIPPRSTATTTESQSSPLVTDEFPAPVGLKIAVGGSATPGTPQWSIYAWDAAYPFGDFSPIHPGSENPWDIAYEAKTANGGYAAIRNNGRIVLRYNSSGGGYMDTEDPTRMRETDIQMAPPEAVDHTTLLSELASLVVKGDVRVDVAPGSPLAEQIAGATYTSGWNLVSLAIAIEFQNTLTGAIFQYQYRLGLMTANADGVTAHPKGGTDWFLTGPKTWGMDDNAPTLFKNNADNDYDYDILPQLKVAIAAGAAEHGMDGDLSHWVVSWPYFGWGQWGALDVKAGWSPPKVLITHL